MPRASPAEIGFRLTSRIGTIKTPLVEDPVDIVVDTLARFDAVDARHQQLVVFGVLVADRGDHGQFDGTDVDGAAGGAAAS